MNTVLSSWSKIEWRSGGVGLFGFDVLPDNDLHLWLIEVNKCPSMQQTTPVTKSLVPRFMRSLLKLLSRDKDGTDVRCDEFDLLYESPSVERKTC